METYEIYYEILPPANHPLTGDIPSYGTLVPSLRGPLLGDPFGPFGSVLRMSAEQIVSKWSFRLVGNTPFGPSPDGGPETGGGTHEIHLRVLPVGVSHVHH